MNQEISFDTSKGGNVHNMCLANVCAGFGIPNKYGSAWEAWEHTEQHTDPIPEGLDVPLFYSYTANIDGVTQNYGHINVRLKDGTVWSDGNIYPNLDAYLQYHTPKYVGWGESINDIKVLGEQDMPTTLEPGKDIDLKRILFAAIQNSRQFNAIINDHTLDAWLDANVNGDLPGVIRNMFGNQESQQNLADIQKGLALLDAPTESPAPPQVSPEIPPTPVNVPVAPAGQGSGFWAWLKKALIG